MPNLPKTLTTHELEEVEAMAGLGLRFEDIANIKGMSDETLRKYAKDHLIRGKAKAKAQVMQTAYKLATSGKVPAMTMFWLKTQAGWRENRADSTDGSQLIEAIRDSNKPTQAVVGYLAETMAQVKRGELDPRVASSIATVAGAFMKAVAQGEMEARLVTLEGILKSSEPESLELDL